MRRWAPGLRARVALAVWLGVVVTTWLASMFAEGSLMESGAPPARLAQLRSTMLWLGIALSTLAALGAWLVAGAITRPAARTGEVARRLGQGDLSARVPVTGTDDVAQLGVRLNEMADSLQEVMSRQRNFVSDTAHELRTPVAALLASASALDNPETRDEASAMVAPQVRRLAALTEDLLSLSRFDDARERLDLRETDLGGLARSAVLQAGADGQVHVDADEVTAVVDPTRVTTIVRNLVVNGLRHGEEPVTVSVRQQDGQACIVVDDAGPGVPPEIRETLFDRFVRGDRSRHGEGSGLGLAIARENAELHGGRLVLGEDGHGFTLALPVDGPATSEQSSGQERPVLAGDWRDEVVSGLFFVSGSLAFAGGLLGPRIFHDFPVATELWRGWLVKNVLITIGVTAIGLGLRLLLRRCSLVVRSIAWFVAMMGLAVSLRLVYWTSAAFGLAVGVALWGAYLHWRHWTRRVA